MEEKLGDYLVGKTMGYIEAQVTQLHVEFENLVNKYK